MILSKGCSFYIYSMILSKGCPLYIYSMICLNWRNDKMHTVGFFYCYVTFCPFRLIVYSCGPKIAHFPTNVQFHYLASFLCSSSSLSTLKSAEPQRAEFSSPQNISFSNY